MQYEGENLDLNQFGNIFMNKSLFMSRIALFKGLSGEDLETLQAATSVKSYREGEIIFFEGDEAGGIYIVIEGRVKVYKSSPEGKEQILHIFEPGEPFAEVAAFQGGRFPAGAMAVTAVSALYLPRGELLGIIKKTPHLALNMLAVLSMRLREFSQTIENLSLRGLPERISSYLLQLSETKGSSNIELHIKKVIMANLLGTTPETLSRVLSRLCDRELISMKGRKINILDQEALKEIANGARKLE
jgi:CRP/FNR family transcriptional regulator, dissimilatory nitrate respiration regulator